MQSVLIADDDALIRSSLGDCLGGIGCTVALAADGKQAMAYLQQKPVDLLLSDVDMPDMNGFELLAWWKSHGAWRQVLLMSGRATTELIATARAAGAIDLLAKPVQTHQLYGIIRSLSPTRSTPF